jgi:hypothetical protein
LRKKIARVAAHAAQSIDEARGDDHADVERRNGETQQSCGLQRITTRDGMSWT